MNPETIKKEFQEKFGSVFEGVHLDHGVHSGFRILTELEESLLSWFLSKLSQAQAEGREKWEQDMASELTKIQELIESYTPETLRRESFGLFCTHILGALEILKRKTYPISTKFPPQTNLPSNN